MSRFFRLIVPVLFLLLLVLASCGRTAPFPTAEPVSVTQQVSLPTPIPSTPANLLDVQLSPTDCLQGIWRMSEDSFNDFITTLLPMPNFSILTGTISLSFDQDLYIYNLDNLTLRFTSSPDNYIQGTGNVSSSGTFSVDGNTILLNNTSTVSEITDWQALINGEINTIPGDPPTLFFTMPGSGVFSCSVDTLTVDTTGTANTPTAMSFERIR